MHSILKADVFRTALAEIQSPNNTQQISTSVGRFANIPPAINGAQLERAAAPRPDNANANNITAQAANLNISPKAVRIPLEIRKSGQYTRNIFPLRHNSNLQHRAVQSQWETKRPSHEDKISKLLGQKWTVDINLPDVYEHATKDYMRGQIGSYFNRY